MKKMPKKFIDRIQRTLRPYQDIVSSIKTRDVSEADTVTVIKDILADIFGFDKYQELTSEQQIRGTFCDLAIKISGKIYFLIEVKSAGITLNESHLRQAIGYGANQGIEWVVLTNAVEWRLYKIEFVQPIRHEEVARFSFVDLNAKNQDDLEKIYLMAREGLSSNAIQEFHQTAQIFNKFTIAQILLSSPVLAVIKREMRRLYPEVKAEESQLWDLLVNDILKREVIEGDKVKEIQSKIKRLSNKIEKGKQKKAEVPSIPSPANPSVSVVPDPSGEG